MGEVKIFTLGKRATVIDLYHHRLTIERIGHPKLSAKGQSAMGCCKFLIAKDFSTGSLSSVELIMVIGSHCIGLTLPYSSLSRWLL